MAGWPDSSAVGTAASRSCSWSTPRFHRLLGLAVVAGTVGIGTHDGKYVVIGAVSRSRHADVRTALAIRLVHVPEIPIAAATLATFGVVGAPTGEHGDRTSLLRRAGVVLAILVGAIAGAGLARWEPWIAWAAIAALVTGVAGLAHRWLAPT